MLQLLPNNHTARRRPGMTMTACFGDSVTVRHRAFFDTLSTDFSECTWVWWNNVFLLVYRRLYYLLGYFLGLSLDIKYLCGEKMPAYYNHRYFWHFSHRHSTPSCGHFRVCAVMEQCVSTSILSFVPSCELFLGLSLDINIYETRKCSQEDAHVNVRIAAAAPSLEEYKNWIPTVLL